MKKILALVLIATMLFTFAACGGKSDETSKPQTSTEVDFVKPENYVTVIKLSINPEFNIYLDKDNNVLAVEPLNDDAKKVKEKLSNTSKNIREFAKEVISATNAAGFVKENASINITITELHDKTINTEEILSNTKTAIEEKVTELKVTVKVETKLEVKEETQKEEIKEETSSKEESKNQTSSKEESKNETSSKVETPTTTPIIYRLFMTDTFNEDGSVNFNVMAIACIQSGDNEKYLKSSLDGIEFNYEIPEDVIYNRLNSTFKITDKIWADFKAKGSYNLEGPETAKYENGKFKYTRYDSWGGGEPITYSIFNFYDNKKGIIEITYQVTPQESNPYRMRVVYEYDKKYADTKYEFIKPNNQYYVGAFSSTNKDFINSLRISKIIESPTKNLHYGFKDTTLMFYLYESNPSALVCYGFGGETPKFDCSCNGNDDISERKWSFNSDKKEATCPCGITVLKDPLIGEVHW